MKKITFTLSAILFLILTACGGASTASQTDSSKLNDSYENALPVPTQLLIGTFNLEGTEFAVTSAQAKELIPLWQVLQSMNDSGSAAQEEIDALLEQMQQTMTPQQIQAIRDMKLTRQDMFAALQKYGNADNNGQAFDPNAEDSGDGGQHPGGGDSGGAPFAGPADGGGHEGGPGGGQGVGLSPDQIATAQASDQQERRPNNTIPSVLVSALIEVLQKKAGS
jgi:hypothetical protein